MVFAMVGLPARGKSFIAMRLCSFFNWQGMECKIFNVGKKRRHEEKSCQDAAYFDHSNSENNQKREALAFDTLGELLQWLDDRPMGYGIFDATNSTVARRRKVVNFVDNHNETHNQAHKVIFIESFCDDPEVLKANTNMKLLRSPDYAHMDKNEALKDLNEREENYKKVYEPLGEGSDKEHDLSYIKLVNLSSHLVAHHIYGRVTQSLLPYLMALHVGSRTVMLMRMPQSQSKVIEYPENIKRDRSSSIFTSGDSSRSLMKKVYGEDSMTSQGEAFVKKLATYIKELTHMTSVQVFACTHRRALVTASQIDFSGMHLTVNAALNPMDWGTYNSAKSHFGVLKNEIADHTSPQFYKEFIADPVRTRFPGGECYADFVRRLSPVIVEIEQQLEPVLIIAPLDTLQVLQCYLSRRPVAEATTVVIPLHTVVQFTPDGGVYTEKCISEEEICKAKSP
eukprot:gnl/MRDRNA2_/MRDRNA2_152875_c0_seq1.p1 gnl/MRDRNA2_/MRDRNA2_152875_c0~~gnl/MRDRNA2_/MRDRNA2_152875_c0_seq1.p1  ORF type:complete len:486 (+),score=69.97 gnl/MRDRNA2_/MRDRNA2_152875_c0_seq1:102-1460(+)